MLYTALGIEPTVTVHLLNYVKCPSDGPPFSSFTVKTVYFDNPYGIELFERQQSQNR